ncbi:2-phospho-L-lactate guanylyltransferase [Biformimicrobium ophioploci]|uniref:3-phospho-D-glycerate guanylyltransferase n=1 Tax=Biformimicrobium ophioploci TaxID=3036711 RepID=A0ABQ6M223_9GAMM|nr:2-phospho-L-lactate guanylyltransferase [Microbulbifer sp. NKW57]GMG88366.1 2-phospho-L-lactate guanylyltransferase [Microbulbifer sp. NKW57]
MWALLPLKEFAAAKQRLSPVLSQRERAALAQAMAEDVLAELRDHPAIENILLVSNEPSGRQLARQFGAEFLSESGLHARGLNQAVKAGVQVLAERGVDNVMVVHGDLPLISAAEIDELVRAHFGNGFGKKADDSEGSGMSEKALTLVSDTAGEGTNCLICNTAIEMQYSFGPNSLAAHLDAAARIGLDARVVPLPGFGCDIDAPTDLLTLLKRLEGSKAKHSLSVVAQFALAERLLTVGSSTYRADFLLSQAG